MDYFKILYFIIVIGFSSNPINSQVKYYSWQDDWLNGSVPTYKPGTKIISDEFGKVYYVTNDGRIGYYWHSNNTWYFTYLSSNIAIQRAQQPSSMEYRNNSIYFVNENNDLSRFYYSNGSWSHQVLNSNAPKVLPGSQITTDEFGKTYYVGYDGRIFYFWWTGSYWQSDALSISTTIQKSKPWTDIEYKNYSLYFCNQNGDMSRFYYSNGSWNHQVLNSNAPKVLNETQITTDEFGKVYYIGSDKKVYVLWSSGTTWNFNILNEQAPQAKAQTDLVYSNSQVFYVSIDNQVNIIYYGECSWEYKCLNSSTTVAPNSGMTIGTFGKLYYINSSTNKVHILYPKITSSHPFVYIKGKDFYNFNTKVDLKVMNYIVDINTNDNINYWASPNLSYDMYPENRLCNNKSNCLNLIQTHFNNIKSLGFSAIRLIGTAVNPPSNSSDINLYAGVITSSPAYSYTDILIENNFESKLFDLTSEVLDCAKNAGLKVILLTGSGGNQNINYHSIYSSYLGRLSNFFKDDTTLMAYDLYNEPSTDNKLNKTQICSAVNGWYNSIRANDPNHLITIGSQTSTDVFNWDPGILSIDFLSFHFYPFPSPLDSHPINSPRKRTSSDIKWLSEISKKINKPWIVGETGFLAALNSSSDTSTDWGTEQDQDNYARYTIDRVKDCGGTGYSWWQYHDVHWDNVGLTLQDYFGLYSHNDTEKFIVTNQTLKNYNPTNDCYCPEPSNYFNYYGYTTFTKHGRIVDEFGNPIKDAVVYGYENDNSTGDGFITYSNSSGYFNLKSNKLVKSLRISGIKYKDKTKYYLNKQKFFNTGLHILTKQNGCFPILKSSNIIKSQIDTKQKNLVKPPSNIAKNFNIQIFPNPAKNEIFLVSNLIIDFISISDMQGSFIKSIECNDYNTEINSKDLQSGLYLITIYSSNQFYTKKIMINK